MVRTGPHAISVYHVWTGARESEDQGNGNLESKKQEVILEMGRSVGLGMKGWGL